MQFSAGMKKEAKSLGNLLGVVIIPRISPYKKAMKNVKIMNDRQRK